MTPAPALVERFRADFEALAGPPERAGVAVSGGPDSLALLLLAAAAYPGKVHAATVDHGLRAASAAEASYVGELCSRIGCPHATLAVEVPSGGEGLQGEARRVRYAALAEWAEDQAVSTVCTAHHADDQAETILMRLQRGAGVGGLSGIRPTRTEGSIRIIRPLLGWTRRELASLVADAGVEAVQDPSNEDDRFDRVAIRRLLQSQSQIDPVRLSRSAAALREADEALDWATDQLAEDRFTSQGGEWRIDPSGLPRELRRRLLSRAIGEVRRAFGLEPPWRGTEDVETLLATLEGGGTGTQAGVMASGGGVWQLRSAPPRRKVSSRGGRRG